MPANLCEKSGSTEAQYIKQDGSWIELSADGGVWVDVQAFETSASSARTSKGPEAYQSVLALYKGDLLPEDLYEDWAVARRETLRQLYLNLLIELANIYENLGEIRQAIEFA